jgi:hypothetical protein
MSLQPPVALLGLNNNESRALDLPNPKMKVLIVTSLQPPGVAFQSGLNVSEHPALDPNPKTKGVLHPRTTPSDCGRQYMTSPMMGPSTSSMRTETPQHAAMVQYNAHKRPRMTPNSCVPQEMTSPMMGPSTSSTRTETPQHAVVQYNAHMPPIRSQL